MYESIWVFGEERSGSTWTSTTLAKILNKQCIYVEESKEHIEDSCWRAIVSSSIHFYSRPNVYFTHRYTILESLKDLLTKPHIIRTTRKDTLSQMLSYFFLQHQKVKFPNWWNFPHITHNDNGNHFDDILWNTKPILIEKSQVIEYYQKKQKRINLWNSISKYYDNDVIFYEDLFTGKRLENLDITLSFNIRGLTIKLPYEKDKLFSNYDQIVEWNKEYEKV